MVEIAGRTYNLIFDEESSWPGVVIKARSTSLGQLLGVADLAASVDAARSGADVQSVLRDSLKVFLDSVVSWNLEVRNAAGQLEPVPVTFEGVASLPDQGVIFAAIEKWRDAQVAVPERSPLPGPSGSGGSLPAGSIPMAPL